jgi:DNA-binding Lrp family transcriptional regulator
MWTTREQKKRQYRSVYELFSTTPRITQKDMAVMMDLDSRTIANRIKEALKLKYIIGPQARKRSYQNLKEYMYLVKCENPELLYLKYFEDQKIVYHVKTAGFCNLWVTAKEKIDIEGDILVKGFRSDYYVSRPPDHSWETAIEIIRKETEIFKPHYATPQNYIQTHFDKTIKWTPEDELLYRYFKYNLRKPFTPPIKEHRIWERNIYNFLERLPETCTVFTDYYPDSLSAYDPYLFMFETDYEDFIIDLFSELPTTSSFFKVSDKLFVYIHVPEQLAKISDLNLSNKFYIPLLIMNLKEKGIVKTSDYIICEYSTGKRL